MFVYFLCFQTPPKRRVVRLRNLARKGVTTTSRTSVGFCVYMGRRYQKNDILKQKYLNVNKHFAALTVGRLGKLASCTKAWQDCAINSVTINSTGYVPGQSSYSRPTGGNGLYVYVPYAIIAFAVQFRAEIH